jgi:hypothetical protein
MLSLCEVKISDVKQIRIPFNGSSICRLLPFK